MANEDRELPWFTILESDLNFIFGPNGFMGSNAHNEVYHNILNEL